MNSKNATSIDQNADSSNIALPLNESETKYQRLYQMMDDAIVLYDYDQEKILDCNKSAVKLLGYTKSEMLQLNRFDIMSDRSRFYPGINIHNEIRTRHRKMIYDGECIDSMGEVISKQGIQLSAKINVIPVGEKSYQGFVIVKDLSKELEQKTTLTQKEKRHRTILDNTHEGIVYYCLNEKKPIDCNKKACIIFEAPSEEVFLNTELDQLYASSLLNELSFDEFFKEIVDHTIQDGTYSYVYQAKRLNGEPFMAKVRAVYDSAQEDQPHIILFIRDIEEKYKATHEMNRLFNQQKQILNSIPAPFIFKDLENNIIACNKALALTRGRSHTKELIGKNLSEFLTKEEVELIHQEDLEIARTGQSVSGVIYSPHDSKGAKRWFRKDKTPFRNELGETTGTLTYIVDVTELIEKNERLKQYIESNKQLDNFAAIASHDLQAPLRTIHSYTQLLSSKLKGKLSEDEQEFMHFIISATGNMRHLIQDLRTYSQVGSTQINISEFSMDDMVQVIISELKATIDFTKANINFPENMPRIKGDRIKIRQLFQNLITNALKYMAKDVIPEVNLSCVDQPEHWYFEIKDNGIGIDEPFQEKIFELFNRLHNNTEYQGTGIGLSLCKKIVEQHQGAIGVRSVEGKGSTFYFTIAKKVEVVDDLM